MKHARATILVLAVMGTLLMGAVACRGGGGGGVEFPETTPFPTDLQDQVHEIRDQVAEMRGLPLKDDVTEGTLSRDDYAETIEAGYDALTEDERSELEIYNVAWRLMRQIRPDEDLVEMFSQSYAEEIAGFYIPEEEELVLIGDGIDSLEAWDEVTIAHEYVHSFQDGVFDWDGLRELAEDEDEDSQTEYGTTVDCVIEGDATLAGFQWAAAEQGEERLQQFGDESETGESTAQLSPAIERYFYFNYNECPAFVAATQQEGGWQAVDALFEDPPWTTEQILHPEKYENREDARDSRPVELEDALDGSWDQADRFPFGEFDVYNYLATILNDESSARIAADGWGSGWLTIYAQDLSESASEDVPAPGAIVHIYVDWDTADEFDEFLAIYGEVLRTIAGDTWESAGDDGPVRWDAENEFGLLAWDEDNMSVDIVISSTEDAREAIAPEFAP